MKQIRHELQITVNEQLETFDLSIKVCLSCYLNLYVMKIQETLEEKLNLKLMKNIDTSNTLISNKKEHETNLKEKVNNGQLNGKIKTSEHELHGNSVLEHINKKMKAKDQEINVL